MHIGAGHSPSTWDQFVNASKDTELPQVLRVHEETAYAAGFFDGEGTIAVASGLRVAIQGCFQPSILDPYRDRWGGELKAGRRKGAKRMVVRWAVSGERAVRFLHDVLPYLREKRFQAEKGLEYEQLRVQFGLYRTPEQRAQLAGLRKQITEDKHREWRG